MEESSWSSILSGLDKDTFSKLQSALYSLKEISETSDEKLPTDPTDAINQLNTKITKLMKGLKSHRNRFQKLEEQNRDLKARICQIESNGYRSPSSPKSPTPSYGEKTRRLSSKTYSEYETNGKTENGGPSDISSPKSRKQHGRSKSYDVTKKKRKSQKLKSMPKTLDELKENDTNNTKHRMHFYQFGSRKLQILKPTEYPIKKDAQRPVEGKLELFYSHGYSGNFDESRQNICLSQDGTKLIYYIAAIAVVYDYENNSQQFFFKHNDDITTLCVSPTNSWVATGQKDPKDEPGQGADLPYVSL